MGTFRLRQISIMTEKPILPSIARPQEHGTESTVLPINLKQRSSARLKINPSRQIMMVTAKQTSQFFARHTALSTSCVHSRDSSVSSLVHRVMFRLRLPSVNKNGGISNYLNSCDNLNN